MTGPAFPRAPQRNATSFQKAAYHNKLRHARTVVRQDLATLRRSERRQLRLWSEQAATAALTTAQSAGSRGGLAEALGAAVADIATLGQTRLSFGTREVIVIVGSEAAVPPRLHVSLAGVTVAIADIPAAADAATWQVGLMAVGARDAFPLTEVTQDRLNSVVSAGLYANAPVAYELAGIGYGPAQYRLSAVAKPELRHALWLLTVAYPDATASIDGYTDDIPVAGGNRLLSWRRAQAVLCWLEAHGVSSARLSAFGYGAADPVAPNGPAGQPLNRRVVLIITPGT